MSTTVTKPIDAKLLELREKAADKARKGIAMQAKGCLLTGQGLLMAAPTFPDAAADPKEYRAWCTDVTHKSWETCRQYIAIAKAHKGLSTEAKTASEGWAFEPQQRLVATPEDLREKVIAESGSYPDVNTVESVRDRVIAEAMTDEEKAEAAKKTKAAEAAKKERDAKGKAEKTEAALDGLKTFFGKKNIDGMTPEDLVLIGVALGAAHGAEHGADGTRQFFLQRAERKAAQAERDAALIAKGKAEAESEKK